MAGSEEPKERGDGTGSGWTNGLVRAFRIQNALLPLDPDSAADELIDFGCPASKPRYSPGSVREKGYGQLNERSERHRLTGKAVWLHSH